MDSRMIGHAARRRFGGEPNSADAARLPTDLGEHLVDQGVEAGAQKVIARAQAKVDAQKES